MKRIEYTVNKEFCILFFTIQKVLLKREKGIRSQEKTRVTCIQIVLKDENLFHLKELGFVKL